MPNLTLEQILSSENIANLLSDEELEEIGVEVIEGYDEDMESRESWEDKYDEWIKLAMQVTEEKSFPWQGAANVKYPLLTTAALQFSSRAYPALIPGVNVVRGRVIGFDPDGSKQERAIRLGKHLSYQILEQMEDWEEEMDRLTTALPIIGCLFKKTYFDSIKGRNVSEVVYPKDLVVNYWATSLETAQRKTQLLHLTDNEIYEREVLGTFIENEYSTPTQIETNRTSDEATGMEQPHVGSKTNPNEFLEQHCFYDLDGDGYAEPYIITAHKDTKQIARIVARFDETGVKQSPSGKIAKIKPVEYYTKFSFIPNPDGGFYDIGFGLLLGPINETINTLINQLLDAGTISNLQAGFLSKGIRIKGGNKPFSPGEWKTVNSTGDDLRKGIVPLPTRDPSNTLFSLLGMLIEGGQKLSAVTDMLTGENPGQNQPATTTMAVIEQGLKVFSSIYKRLHRSLKKEYKKLYRLNSIYLEDIEYFTILDVGQEQGSSVKREDYNIEDVDVIPFSDPNISSEAQKLAKIAALGELLQLGTINPVEYTRRALEAQEQPSIELLMQMPPPQPNPEFELETFKVQDESEREWAKIEIEKYQAGIKEDKVASDFVLGSKKIQSENERGAAEMITREESQKDEQQRGVS